MLGQSGCVVIGICTLIYFQVVFFFNFQRLFPVLEEGIFAKNLSFNHVSSILVTVLDFFTSGSWFQHTQASHPECWEVHTSLSQMFFNNTEA